MIKKVTFTQGVGNYSKKWGHSRFERYVFANALVSEASPCYWKIEGKAKVYKGRDSDTLLREEELSLRVMKTNRYLKIVEVPHSVHFISED